MRASLVLPPRRAVASLTAGFGAVLLATTIAQRVLPAETVRAVLQASSTDVAHLATRPIRVLVLSAVWLDGDDWLPALVAVLAGLAVLERRVGATRAGAVFASAHVGATALTQGAVAAAIALHRLPAGDAHMLDVGVSYGMFAVLAACAGALPGRWRWLALTAVAAYAGVPLLTDLGVTSAGHALSVAIGAAWWPWLWRRREAA